MEALAQEWLLTVGLLRDLVASQPPGSAALESLRPDACSASRGSAARRQRALQLAVEGANWVYSCFWRLDKTEGVLQWSRGTFSGPPGRGSDALVPCIALLLERRRRRQVLQAMSARMLRNQGQVLEDWIGQLSPLEWFYLTSSSFSFPPGVGCPGQALASGRPQWLCGVGSCPSVDFTRASMASAAGIQTVLCIPVEGGVVELGTVDLVPEDPAMVDFVRSLFTSIGLRAVDETLALLRGSIPLSAGTSNGSGSDPAAQVHGQPAKLQGPAIPKSPRHAPSASRSARRPSVTFLAPPPRRPFPPGSSSDTPHDSTPAPLPGEGGGPAQRSTVPTPGLAPLPAAAAAVAAAVQHGELRAAANQSASHASFTSGGQISDSLQRHHGSESSAYGAGGGALRSCTSLPPALHVWRDVSGRSSASPHGRPAGQAAASCPQLAPMSPSSSGPGWGAATWPSPGQVARTPCDARDPAPHGLQRADLPTKGNGGGDRADWLAGRSPPASHGQAEEEEGGGAGGGGLQLEEEEEEEDQSRGAKRVRLWGEAPGSGAGWEQLFAATSLEADESAFEGLPDLMASSTFTSFTHSTADL